LTAVAGGGKLRGMKVKNKEAAKLGKRIRQVRQAKGFTLSGFARLAEMDKGHLCRVELGVVEAELPTLRQIAKMLGVSASYLIDPPRAA
jgi:transcriptional regulator with XRE-family HTH domain